MIFMVCEQTPFEAIPATVLMSAGLLPLGPMFAIRLKESLGNK